MVKVINNQGQYKITIPKDIAEAKGWGSGTRLLVMLNAEGDIVLKEIPSKKRGIGGTSSPNPSFSFGKRGKK